MTKPTTGGYRWIVVAAALFLVLSTTTLWGTTSDRDLKDTEIEDAIEIEMVVQDDVPFDPLDVDVTDGVATLSGTVTDHLAKDRAVRLAEAVRGVRSVVDLIEVAPSNRTDGEIERDVESALLADPATESYEVETSVSNGAVTLEGAVDSWQERQLAERVAKGVRGVTTVDNQLLVDYRAERSDREIQADVEQRLHWDLRVDDALIDVAVDDGEVTLSGTVGSAAEKRRAGLDSYVNGVRSVDDSGLEVSLWARDDRLRENKLVQRPDDEIEDAVRDAFLYDPRVLSFEPEIDVEHGIVTLRGVVDNPEAKRAAERTARNTVGVWRVINHLKVRPASIPDDAILETRVRDALLRDPITEVSGIDVDANHGTVTLTGVVDTYYERLQAGEIASQTRGAVLVDNNLTVSGDPLLYRSPTYSLSYDPYGLPWSIVTDSGDHDDRPDWEIRSDIESQLFWSPFVNEGEVDVLVVDGVAILTGTVDTWQERQAAEENAYEGGARKVDNKLDVDFGPNLPL